MPRFNSLLEMLRLNDARGVWRMREFQFSIGDARGFWAPSCGAQPPPRFNSLLEMHGPMSATGSPRITPGFNSLLEMPWVRRRLQEGWQLIHFIVSILYWRCGTARAHHLHHCYSRRFNSLLEMRELALKALCRKLRRFQFSIGDALRLFLPLLLFFLLLVSILYWRCLRPRRFQSIRDHKV